TTFQITFSPTTTGEKTAIVSIANDDSDENPYTFTITGEGINPPTPEIGIKQGENTLSNGSGDYNFGSVEENGSSGAVTFTIENTGTGDLELTGDPLVQISGSGADQFSVESQPGSDTIAADASETFALSFSPTSLGTKTATVTIINSD